MTSKACRRSMDSRTPPLHSACRCPCLRKCIFWRCARSTARTRAQWADALSNASCTERLSRYAIWGRSATRCHSWGLMRLLRIMERAFEMGWMREIGRRASGPVNGLDGFGIKHRSATCHSSGGGTLMSASQPLSAGRYLSVRGSAAMPHSLEGATPGGRALLRGRLARAE